MKLATWNINSLRIRGPILQHFIAQHAPDVLCLQETKVEDAQFPHDLVRELGFPHVVFAGQKSYNGVAILAKHPIALHSTMDVLNNGDKRHIAATLHNGITVHNFYIPAGGDIPDVQANPKFRDKLAFVDTLKEWSATLKPKEKNILVGDLNIAPLEHDVWSSKQLRDVVSHTPIERDKMHALIAAGKWIDAARHFVPETEKLYSWWSYRTRDWKASNRGRRLDHVWVSPTLKEALKSVEIFKETRDLESTSDHVPVIVTLAA
jgi:exodeoxyribonuclease-3